VRRKGPELWRNHNWLLHHAHTSQKTTEFVTNNNMIIIPDPAYSPELASCDFPLFAKLKIKIKGRRFETVSDIQMESQTVLDSIKETDFSGALNVEKTMGSLYTFPSRLF
jgi:hypothetical protein